MIPLDLRRQSLVSYSSVVLKSVSAHPLAERTAASLINKVTLRHGGAQGTQSPVVNGFCKA